MFQKKQAGYKVHPVSFLIYKKACEYPDFYPGNDNVNIISADIYHRDDEQKEYNEFLELAKGKLVVLTEVGELPGVDVLKAQPKWSWF